MKINKAYTDRSKPYLDLATRTLKEWNDRCLHCNEPLNTEDNRVHKHCIDKFVTAWSCYLLDEEKVVNSVLAARQNVSQEALIRSDLTTKKAIIATAIKYLSRSFPKGVKAYSVDVQKDSLTLTYNITVFARPACTFCGYGGNVSTPRLDTAETIKTYIEELKIANDILYHTSCMSKFLTQLDRRLYYETRM